jgi:hypothetical protein
MTFRWRLRRILLLMVGLLLLSLLERPWEPPFYYERAKWDGRRWVPQPQPTELELFVAWAKKR